MTLQELIEENTKLRHQRDELCDLVDAVATSIEEENLSPALVQELRKVVAIVKVTS